MPQTPEQRKEYLEGLRRSATYTPERIAELIREEAEEAEWNDRDPDPLVAVRAFFEAADAAKDLYYEITGEGAHCTDIDWGETYITPTGSIYWTGTHAYWGCDSTYHSVRVPITPMLDPSKWDEIAADVQRRREAEELKQRQEEEARARRTAEAERRHYEELKAKFEGTPQA